MTLQERGRLGNQVVHERAYGRYLALRRHLSEGFCLKEAAHMEGYSLDGATKLVRRYRQPGRRF